MNWSNYSGLLFKKRFKYKERSQELFIILPPWKGRLGLNSFLRKSILRRNCSVLEYEFPKEILSSDWKKTLEFFQLIRELVLQDIKELKDKYKFSEISIIGTSLGCVNACMIADNNNVNILCLVVPSHCLAEVVWQGKSTQEIRKDFEDNNVSFEDLKKYWRGLAPESNIKNLRAEKIMIYASEADRVVPFYSGKTLIEKIKSYNHPVFYKIHKNLGHKMTGLLFYLTPNKFLFN